MLVSLRAATNGIGAFVNPHTTITYIINDKEPPSQNTNLASINTRLIISFSLLIFKTKGNIKALIIKHQLIYDTDERLILAPYPSTREYKPIKIPVNSENFKILKLFLSLCTKPRVIIPEQTSTIDNNVKNLKTTPKNKTEINVVTRGPNPLKIG